MPQPKAQPAAAGALGQPLPKHPSPGKRAMTTPKHPLEPLTADEVRLAVSVLRDSGKVTPTTRFVSVSLKEPPKDLVHAGRTDLPREAFVVLFDNGTNTAHESVAERLNLIVNVSIGLGAAISIAAVVVLVAKARRLDALFWMLAVGGVLALDLPLKQVFHRPPIDDPGGGYSFPSGNAMASAACPT